MRNTDRTGMTDSATTHVRGLSLTPDVFLPHPGFSAEVNRNIAQSEIEGGVCLDALSEGAVLEVETQHHWYTIVNRSGGETLISGHSGYCPEPVPVRIAGST